MAQTRLRDRRVRNVSIGDALWAEFDSLRQAHRLTKRQAVAEALRLWIQARTAEGRPAVALAPALEEALARQFQDFERRLRPLWVKGGMAATTALEVLLEQRRRNGHDVGALLRSVEEAAFRRFKDTRQFIAEDLAGKPPDKK